MASALWLLAWVLLPSPSHAGADAWGSYEEGALHSSAFANYEGLASDLFATCDDKGALHLPTPYLKDYTLTPKDTAAFERMMSASKRFADVREALKDGYLPVTSQGFLEGIGLRLGHPDLLKDGDYNPDRPDVLTFVKKKGEPRYRLAGLLYVAGKTLPARKVKMDFNAKSRKKKGKAADKKKEGWGNLNEVCLQVQPGRSVSIKTRAEVGDGCAGGTFYPQIYGLYAWPLVYNPNGIFHEKNPMVDFLDRQQNFGALCAKAAPKKP